MGTRPPGELQALLTSGPAGDGLPGMGLVIGGVITVQIHPVVIRIDLGGGPVPLRGHLIRATSWRLEKMNMATGCPPCTLASPEAEKHQALATSPRFTGKRKKKVQGSLFDWGKKKTCHIHDSCVFLFHVKVCYKRSSRSVCVCVCMSFEWLQGTALGTP